MINLLIYVSCRHHKASEALLKIESEKSAPVLLRIFSIKSSYNPKIIVRFLFNKLGFNDRNVMRKYFLLVTLAVLFGCSSKPHVIKSQKPFTGLGSHEAFVVSHGWHTGFVVPAKVIQTKIPKLKNRFSKSQFIEFGWGDRGFYQAQEITSGLTIRAILWPTESVVHAVSVPYDPHKYFSTSEIEKIYLTTGELESLIDFIAASFYRDGKGEVVEQKRGIYGDSQFYKGVGDYYLMNTCNKWTAKGLQSIGMNISPIFKLTAGSVMSYVEEVNQSQIKP